MWMDPAFAEQGAHPVEEAATDPPRNIRTVGGKTCRSIRMPRSRSPPSAGCPNSPRASFATCAPAGRSRKPGSTIGCACSARSARAEYLKEQPFDQVPCFSDGEVQIFESGAIVQYIGEKSEALLPRDPQGKYRAIQWTYAALNSVEPAILNLLLIDVFFAGEEWAKLRRPGRRGLRQAEAQARLRLARRQGVARGRPLHHRRPR